jgi:vacuolar-type H+-ATPase subunit H
LKFKPEEIKAALNDLTGIQQMAVFNELLKDLNENEIAALNSDFSQKTEPERNQMLEDLVKARRDNQEFKTRVQAAAKKVLDGHITYLKTRGDDNQKQIISQILSEVSQ